MKKLLMICISAGLILAAEAMVMATPVPVPLRPENFNDLLGGSASAIGTPTVTGMATDNLIGEVISQAFTDGQGNYAYLYQVKNIGTVGNSVIEVFTCSPFFDVSASTTLGYLTDNHPEGFTLGEQPSAGVSVDPAAGPTVSFGFPGWMAQAIDPGEASSTLYVLSNGLPGIITGNIIDGTAATGGIVGPIPEPATVVLLGISSCFVLPRRKRGK